MKRLKIVDQPVPVLLKDMYLVNPQLNSIVKGIQSMARRKKLTVRMTSSFDEVIDWCFRGNVRAAIVKKIASAAGGEVSARNNEQGGLTVRAVF